MLAAASTTRVYLYMQAVDMRRSCDGLHAIVQSEFARDIRQTDCFIFIELQSGIPLHDENGPVARVSKPNSFQREFKMGDWLRSCREGHIVIAKYGKTLRSSRGNSTARMCCTALRTGEPSIGLFWVSNRSIKNLELKGAIITTDATGESQGDCFTDIRMSVGDLAIKDKHPALAKAIAKRFDKVCDE